MYDMAEKIQSLRALIKPTDRQLEFFRAVDTHKFTMYGGAKGGGKSYILRWCVLRNLLNWSKQGFKGVRGVIFCEDYPSLTDRQISKINTEFPSWLGTLGGSQTDGMSFRVKPQFGGSVIALRNLDDPSKYASSEFAIAAVDELTKNEREKFDQLRSIIRWPGIEDTKFIAGTNPGGIGHAWVKKLWIDREFTNEDPYPEQVAFIQSLPTDNPHNAKSYLEELQKLPEKLRKAYWDGNWDVFEGQFFAEWDKQQHVIEPFSIPDGWRKMRSIDVSGRNGITSCHWFAVDYDGNVFAYREYYATGFDADQHAREIAALSVGERYDYSIMDASAWSKLGLPETIFEMYQREGVQGLIPASKDRVAGWTNMHSFLRWTEDTPPKLKFFKNCYNAIRTIPLLLHDEIHIDDVDSDGEDHAADEIRYFLQTLRGQSSPDLREKELPQTVESLILQRLARLKAPAGISQYDYA